MSVKNRLLGKENRCCTKGAENPVNVLAKEHFDGCGYVNAVGRMSDLTVEEALEKWFFEKFRGNRLKSYLTNIV